MSDDGRCRHFYVFASHAGGNDMGQCFKPQGHKKGLHVFADKLTTELTQWATGDQNEVVR
jgi:hypothetical protein